MIIMGIDPGTATTGWGIVKKVKNSVTAINFGIISTKPDMALPERLMMIFSDIQSLISEYRPDEVVVEDLFFNTNAKTALLVGQARGVVIVAAKNLNCGIFSYTPLQVKMAITGYGRADKPQMQKMVSRLLNLKSIPRPDDAADALAVALTHGFTMKLK